MWLPETAVDLETLEILAEHGIKFTILASRQAKRVRKIGGRNWKDVSDERIDPTMVYRLRLPSRRFINLFFYDGPISRGVAFEGCWTTASASRAPDGRVFRGPHLARTGPYRHRWRNLWPPSRPRRDGADLRAGLYRARELAELTNYGEYLERHPPTHEVEIFENSSWSCVHGVERWRSNCGCNAGHAGWNQDWRGPCATPWTGCATLWRPASKKRPASF